MRRIIGVKSLTALFLLATTFGAIQPAQAASAHTRGASCKLSANWTVSMSATWYGNDLQYAVLTSPGPLGDGNILYINPSGQITQDYSRANAYSGSGPSGTKFYGYFTEVPNQNGFTGYTYRANIVGVDNYKKLDILPVSYGTNVTCPSVTTLSF